MEPMVDLVAEVALVAFLVVTVAARAVTAAVAAVVGLRVVALEVLTVAAVALVVVVVLVALAVLTVALAGLEVTPEIPEQTRPTHQDWIFLGKVVAAVPGPQLAVLLAAVAEEAATVATAVVAETPGQIAKEAAEAAVDMAELVGQAEVEDTSLIPMGMIVLAEAAEDTAGTEEPVATATQRIPQIEPAAVAAVGDTEPLGKAVMAVMVTEGGA